MKKIIILAVTIFIVSPAVFSQEKAGKKDTAKHATLYTCSMHPDVVMYKKGKCPTCGMKLEVSKKELMKREVTKNYTCPAHADVISTKAGKCPQCGAELSLSPKEKMKMEVMKKFTCPMHPDATSDKAGKCPKCGMDLTEKK